MISLPAYGCGCEFADKRRFSDRLPLHFFQSFSDSISMFLTINTPQPCIQHLAAWRMFQPEWYRSSSSASRFLASTAIILPVYKSSLLAWIPPSHSSNLGRFAFFATGESSFPSRSLFLPFLAIWFRILGSSTGLI